MTQVSGKIYTIRVGKDGLDESALAEMRTQLNRHGTIKVQLNRELAKGSAKNEMKLLLARELNARVLHAVGFVVVLQATKVGGS